MTFPAAAVEWRGTPAGDAPLVVLLHGRGSRESLAEAMTWFRGWLDEAAGGRPVVLVGFRGGAAGATSTKGPEPT